MATKAQNAANRRNSRESTGPRTPEGKSKSSMNSVKHGLTAKQVVIPGEDPSEFDEFRRQVHSYYEPVGWREFDIVDRIAAQLWRLRRVPVIEAGIFSYLLAKIELEISHRESEQYDFDGIGNLRIGSASDRQNAEERERKAQNSLEIISNSAGAAFIEDVRYGNALGNLGRHETTITKSLYLALAELECVQANRKAQNGRDV